MGYYRAYGICQLWAPGLFIGVSRGRIVIKMCGRGIWANYKRHAPLLFSERNGFTPTWNLGPFAFGLTR